MSEAKVWYKNPAILVPIIAALIAAIGGITAAIIDGDDDVELCTVQGVVTSADGIPVADAVVEINGLSSKTDVSGVYIIHGASAGKKTVMVHIPKQEPIKRTMKVPEGHENIVFDIALPSFPAPEPAPAPAPTPEPEQEPEPEPVASVSVSPSSPTIEQGTKVKLVATVRDALGNELTDRYVQWQSDNPSVASVDTVTGLVTGKSQGTTTITATSEGKSDMVDVTVTPPPVGSVTISPSGGTIEVDGNLQLTATVRDTKGNQMTGMAVSWEPSNPTVATVSASGVVTGISAGTCTITASAEGVQDSVIITVPAPTYPEPTLNQDDEFAPNGGKAGDYVFIYGENLDILGLQVKFGTKTATIVEREPTRIKVVVPDGVLGSVNILVSTLGGSVVSTESFAIYP